MPLLKDVIPTVLKQLESPESLRRQSLVNRWSEIVGPKIAQHTKPLLGRDAELLIWTDQSSLAYELNQRYRPTILKRVHVLLGENAVRRVRIRVGELRP